jgi:preprotein translocase subunit SecG
MLLGLLLTLNIMICLALIGVVLLQRSEGGALGSGSPTGLITTRGAGDLLTRTTWVLFSLFLLISLSLTLLGGHERSSQSILNRLKLQSINPDTLPTSTSTPSAAPGAALPPPVLAPTQPSAAPPSATLTPPPTLSAPVPKVRIPKAAKFSTPASDIDSIAARPVAPTVGIGSGADTPAPAPAKGGESTANTPAPQTAAPPAPKPAGGASPATTPPQ